jgi:SAM-dependent methyltransferase
VTVREHERANRATWDGMADWYQAHHGVEISARPDAWGAWRHPESELRLLPEVLGRDVLEVGCGAGQWSVWLAGQGARVTGLDLSAAQLGHARSAAAAFDLLLSDHGAMSWGDPDRTLPEAARVLRPGGLLVFCVTSPLFHACWDAARDAPGDRLNRAYFGLHALDEGNGAATFNLPYGEWIRRFRANGLAVEALVEPRPPPGSTSTFWDKGTDWARRWPAELIWKVRPE